MLKTSSRPAYATNQGASLLSITAQKIKARRKKCNVIATSAAGRGMKDAEMCIDALGENWEEMQAELKEQDEEYQKETREHINEEIEDHNLGDFIFDEEEFDPTKFIELNLQEKKLFIKLLEDLSICVFPDPE